MPTWADERPNLDYILPTIWTFFSEVGPSFQRVLGGSDCQRGVMVQMMQRRDLIGGAGMTFTHALTLSPKCTPSRTGQLVGSKIASHART